MANYHVTTRKGSSKFFVVKENTKRASATAGDQTGAEKIAKEFSANSGGGEVKIHRVTGKKTIRDSDTVKPGNESKTKDKKF